MPLFLRLIALLLMLTTGGVPQTLALVGDGVEDCAGEEDDGPCADCAGDCGLCPYCPLRAIPATPVLEMLAEVTPPEQALVSLGEPALLAVGTDIFQPPRA
ncbi:hypothetical protein D187_001944 [Cystobacter fuscus DSM 2262]|uniref:4Fe-4S ferredoxin-type domain-containing protein n=1 Tax=Cystobacter fuscus (strain ATCC 25194 / DSM 2262 / NBRC 100088 / M29) TaxID=1242864 RepID=S9PDQ8_CYSF2|nr:hypothetical protein [Cystobacter fuscus]EPX60457.1 hypothetical protein D187_001944 [Cystobacter fuscus DSM 2262]